MSINETCRGVKGGPMKLSHDTVRWRMDDISRFYCEEG